MRALVILVGIVLAAPIARAETVLVLSEPGAQLDTALRVAMAWRGVAVTGAPVPSGELRIERAAMAQRTAAQLGADAAVWIDDADVCAVTADGRDFRHAPLSSDATSSRAFAAIASSLLDEMMHPDARLGVDVDVDVRVGPRTPRVAVATAERADAPGLAAVTPVPTPVERPHADRTQIEVGPMVSPLTIGVQAGVAFPLSQAWRIVASGAINKTFDGDHTLGIAAAEIRHVGVGRKHWDIGPEFGYATDGIDPAVFAGVRFARTWELSSTALSLAITPVVFRPLEPCHTSLGPCDLPPVLPGIYTSLSGRSRCDAGRAVVGGR